ncbi:phosphoenolpyruvate--protein phosphotransferase [Luteitalea sp. TBR-22]|uniref:phosphoenolpyruvate--protein phosphotransferase n=1 Tax=Luteitalea sp. TBR-22 TaxID=2802971 RepID=UPI001EF59130|nr:phosphoenolpyruvate--protein phosphotransferase [Luteitalea sp. TBR-22]
MLTGIAVAPGEAIGPAVVARLRAHDVRYRIAEEDVPSEQARLAAASARTRTQLEDIRDRTRHVLGSELAGMFDVQILMLSDPLLRERAEALIRARRVNAEWAVVEAGEELVQRLRAIEDPYLQERHGDLTDVLGRIRANLQKVDGDASWLNAQLARFNEPCVFVADDLPVSVAAQLDWSRLAALATDAGTRTAHTAILARSMGVPAVVGLQEATRMVPPGATLLVDGTTGVIAVDPPPSVVEATRHRLHAVAVPAESLSGPARTADDVPVLLFANIERAEDVPFAWREGAEGLGLVRSELLLGGQPIGQVSEQAQVDVYRAVLDHAGPREVTIRTFDITPEEVGLPEQMEVEPRERLGMRGLRLGLARPEVLERQLRALIRAGDGRQLRIMFPFVTSADEMARAVAMLHAQAERLGLPAPPAGAMVEVPAAALDAGGLARHAAFLSIGTNDLTQYTLAADRSDVRVQHLYDPRHPAVLRLIRMVVRGARRHGRRVAVCGEMASDTILVQVLLGLGLREFSMAATSLRQAREALAGCSIAEARDAALRALYDGDIAAIDTSPAV